MRLHIINKDPEVSLLCKIVQICIEKRGNLKKKVCFLQKFWAAAKNATARDKDKYVATSTEYNF